jgi:pimeloyl-ACP methyl ester carboxylesterase
MSGTGALVLAFSPGAAALDRLGWVWPPLLLVLAVWTERRARQQLRTRARTWLVLPVIGVLALSAVGGGYETVRAAADRHAIAAPGRLVDIGGRSLHLRCSGSGSPTVVLLNGLGEHSTSWPWVTERIARTTTVCAYDRAGQAWSDDAPQAPDGRAVAADLHALMARAGVPGPYVLAGHSTGGLYAQVFAQRYPQDVAGVVLLDSLTPRAMTALPTYPRFYATFRRGSALMPSLARTGLGQVVFAGAGGTHPAADRRAERAIQTSPREQRSGRAEFAALRATFTQAGQLTSLGDVPLAVVTAGRSMQSGWLPEQRRMATLSTNTAQRTVPWEHADLVWARTGSAASSEAIEAVVAAARSGGRVTMPEP